MHLALPPTQGVERRPALVVRQLGHVVNVTDTARDKTAFKKCVDPGEKREDAEFYADLVEKELEEGASAAGKSVEETYAGVRIIVFMCVYASLTLTHRSSRTPRSTT